MKALLVDSNRAVKTSDGTVYSLGRNPYWRYTRYLKFFDEILVISRMTDVENAPKGLEKSSGNGLIFIGIKDDHGNIFTQLFNNNYRIIKKYLCECDALIIRSSRHGFTAAHLAESMNIPWAVEVNADIWDSLWNYGKIQAKIYALYAHMQARYWIKKAPYAIYVTNNTLQEKYPCSGVIAGVSNVEIHPVDDAILENRLNKISTHRHRTPFKIGLIGSLTTKYKGVQIAIKALSLIRDQLSDCKFHVLGAGDSSLYRALAEKLSLDKQIFFDGLRPSGQPVMQWLDDIDLYIQPSFQEGLPRALAEAMSRGCPALGSTAGGIPELLEADCLHRSGDAKQLAAHLKKAIHDHVWRMEQAKLNFEKAKKYYKSELDIQRNQFWADFASYVKAKQK